MQELNACSIDALFMIITRVSKFSSPGAQTNGSGAQTIGPGVQQTLVGAVRKINLNFIARWHYHISFVVFMKIYISQ